MKILVYYKASHASIELLKQAGFDLVISGGEVSWFHDDWAALETIDESVRKEILIMIGSPMPADEKMMQLLPNLKWIHSTHAGLSGDTELDWDLIEKYGISITTSKVHATPISEMAVAMILALYKRIPEFLIRKAEHKYSYSTAPKTGILFGKRVLIVGTGHIGREIGRKLKVGFDMHLTGINSNGHEVKYFDEAYAMDSLETLLPKADIVVLSCALTESTMHLIDNTKLSLMKTSAVLINIARGQVILQSDLVSALKEKRIAGAGLDVFEVEPLPKDDELWDMPNVIITPHISGLFEDYDESVMQLFIKNYPYFKEGNLEKVEEYANIKRY